MKNGHFPKLHDVSFQQNQKLQTNQFNVHLILKKKQLSGMKTIPHFSWVPISMPTSRMPIYIVWQGSQSWSASIAPNPHGDRFTPKLRQVEGGQKHTPRTCHFFLILMEYVLANQFCWILKNHKNGSEILHLALRSASNMPALQWTPDFFYPFNVSGTWNRNAASLTLGAKRCELLPMGPNCQMHQGTKTIAPIYCCALSFDGGGAAFVVAVSFLTVLVSR